MTLRNIEPQDNSFTEAWRAFKDEDATWSAPPSVSAAVIDAWHRELARQELRPVRESRLPSYLAVAAAALLILGVGLFQLARISFTTLEPPGEPIGSVRPTANGPERPGPTALSSDLPAGGPSDVRPLMPARAARDANESEPLQLVRVRMPREALQVFGVSLIEPEAAGFVDVELVVAEDGLARGIRSVTAVADARQE